MLLLFATVATGLVAGFFYAYACSVMVGLARTDDLTFISTMQWINATVRNFGFAPSFFGSLIVTAVAAVWMVPRRQAGARWVVLAVVLYAAAFALTLGVSVPLNDQLAAAGPPRSIANPAAVRAAYEGPWVRWNLVRTVLATGALTALVLAMLSGRRRATAV